MSRRFALRPGPRGAAASPRLTGLGLASPRLAFLRLASLRRPPPRLGSLRLSSLPLASLGLGAVLVGLSPHAEGQARWFERDGAQPGQRLGSAIRGGVDLDADGVGDLVVGAAGHDAGAAVDSGLVQVLSGADGGVIAEFSGAAGEGLGADLDWLGDLDGDGVPDFIVSSASGRVWLKSGATGAELRAHHAPGTEFGHRVRGAGDLDGDAVPDYLVADPSDNIAQGAVHAYSGATGLVLYSLRDPNWHRLGTDLDAAGDIDGDGREDFVVGAPSGFPAGHGNLVVFSGASGAVLHHLGGSANSRLGTTVGGGGDLDGDGVPDVLATAPGSRLVVAISGASGGVIWFEVAASHVAPHAVNIVGDVTGDGRDDFCVATVQTLKGTAHGIARLYSGGNHQAIYEFADDWDHPLAELDVEGLGDLDGDGRGEVAVAGARTSPGGRPEAGKVVVWLGQPLFMSGHPKRAFAHDLITLRASEGVPGNPCALFEEIVGIRLPFLKYLSRFDAAGTYQVAGVLPPGFAGIDVRYIVFAIDESGKAIVTPQERLQLR